MSRRRLVDDLPAVLAEFELLGFGQLAGNLRGINLFLYTGNRIRGPLDTASHPEASASKPTPSRRDRRRAARRSRTSLLPGDRAVGEADEHHNPAY